MLHSKLLQKYLASVVCCLVLVMGISTILLAYSFHIRRSPLLVKALGFEGNLETPNRGHLMQSSEQTHSFFKEIASDNQFTTFRNITKNEQPALTEKTILDKHNDYEGNPYKIETFADSDKKEENFENFAYTDTIYIDDFERSKTNNNLFQHSISKEHKIQDNDLVEKSMEETKSSVTRVEASIGSRNGRKKQRKNNKNLKEKVISNPKTGTVVSETKDTFPHQIQTNLDVTYDIQKNVQHTGTRYRDDTEDDLSANGSGSGDYSVTDDTEIDELPYFDNFVVQHFSADWGDSEHRMTKGSLSGKRALERTEFKLAKQPQKSKFMIGEKHSQDFSHSKTLNQQKSGLEVKRNGNMKYLRKKEKAHKRSRLMHFDSPLDNVQKPFTSEEELMHKQIKAIGNSKSSPAAWVETRTRRIMGNVKKSEERSRQLLLCEEAGGGELCRMLFKGHVSE